MDNTINNNQNSNIGSKVPHYQKNIGDSIFKVLNDNTFESKNIQVHIDQQDECDFSALYSLLPMDREYNSDGESYFASSSIVGEENTRIKGGLGFVMANVEYDNGLIQKEIFEDGVEIEEAYRGGNIALDIYKCMIEFAKSRGVKKINSDCDMTKGSKSIRDKLSSLGYKASPNISSYRSENDNHYKSQDNYPNFTITL